MSTIAVIETELESRTLLRANDPAPVTVLNATARANAVIVCDHGGDAGAVGGLIRDEAGADVGVYHGDAVGRLAGHKGGIG